MTDEPAAPTRPYQWSQNGEHWTPAGESVLQRLQDRGFLSRYDRDRIDRGAVVQIAGGSYLRRTPTKAEEADTKRQLGLL